MSRRLDRHCSYLPGINALAFGDGISLALEGPLLFCPEILMELSINVTKGVWL